MTRLLIASLVIAGNLAAADHLLKITPETVAWGYYWSAAKPVLTVKSGDTVTVECVSVGNPNDIASAKKALAAANAARGRAIQMARREESRFIFLVPPLGCLGALAELPVVMTKVRKVSEKGSTADSATANSLRLQS